MRAMVGRPMKEWTIALETVAESTRAQAEALVRFMWGSSARVISVNVEEKTITIWGPDSESAVQTLRTDLNAGRGVPRWR